METKIVPVHGLEREVHITVPSAILDPRVDEEVKNYAKRARLKGFREGKVPDTVIDSRYGDEIRKEVMNDIAQEYVDRAFVDLSISPTVFMNLDFQQGNRGEDLTLVTHVAVPPDVDLSVLEHLNLVHPRVEIDDDFINERVERFRQSQRSFDSVDRPAVLGDRVQASIKNLGTEYSNGDKLPVDGEPEPISVMLVDSEEASDYDWVSATINERLIGVQVGDTFEIEAFPPDATTDATAIEDDSVSDESDVDVAGEDTEATADEPDESVVDETDSTGDDQSASTVSKYHAQYEITEVAESNLPELDDVFFARDDIDVADIDELKQNIREGEQNRIDERSIQCVAAQVFSQLYAMFPFPLRPEFEDQVLLRYGVPDSELDFDDEGELSDGENHDPANRREQRLKAAITNLVGSVFVSKYAAEKDIQPRRELVEERLNRQLQTFRMLGLDPSEYISQDRVRQLMTEDIQIQVLESLVVTVESEQLSVSEERLMSSEILDEMREREPNGGPFEWHAEEFDGFEIAGDGEYIDLVKKAAEEERARLEAKRNRPKGVVGRLKSLFGS